MHICAKWEHLIINIMGREHRAHAVFETDEEANAYTQANEGSAVIAVMKGRIYIANAPHSGTTKH